MILPTGRILLLGHPGVSWREWLKENRGDRDLVLLDPSDPAHGYPGRISLLHGEKVMDWRFYGSLDPQRAPHVLLAGLADYLTKASPTAIFQLFAYRPRPLLRQIAIMMAQLIQPEFIFIAKGTSISYEGWPVGPQEVELDKGFPEMVVSAQRKAQWLKMIEDSEQHEVDLAHVSLFGSRLGSGVVLNEAQRNQAGLSESLRAEVTGSGLLIVADHEIDDGMVARALDTTHTSKADILEPSAFSNVLCSFAKQDGEDFGMGILQSLDFEKWTAQVLCTAIPPAPVRLLKIGSLRVDEKGRELGETRPWQL